MEGPFIPGLGRWMVGQRRVCECAALGLVPVDVWLPQRVLPSCGMFFLHVLFFVFVFSSDLDTDDDLNSDDYEYEDEAKLVIFPDHYEIALPNIEELPALVSECARLLARCAWLSVSGVCACAVCVHLGVGKAGWMWEEEENGHRREHSASSLRRGLTGLRFRSLASHCLWLTVRCLDISDHILSCAGPVFRSEEQL